MGTFPCRKLIVSALVAIVAIVLCNIALPPKARLEDWFALAVLLVFLPRIGVAFNGMLARFHTRSC